tara:strand:+ start:1073 stop:2203 length:1131 start_codon:yes stop_codon:yes gene_type:complete
LISPILNDKKLIIPFTFLLLFLPFFEFGIDFYFGDQDGSIIKFNISEIIKFFQLILLIIVASHLYKIKVIYCLVFIFINYIIIDFGIIGRILVDYEYIHRYPHPYVGFTGKPNKDKHNQFGFLGPELSQAKSDDFTIAFFGGSTGYRGNPSLPVMIERVLKKNNFKNGKVFISNFSAESSNHNQHLHMLIEFVLTSKVDLVMFYGGWNETVGQTAYDPRPGYPLNFFYIHDEPHWKKFLIENSKIFGSLQHKIVNKKRSGQIIYSEEWNRDIVNNYFETLNKARLIVNVLEPNIMEKPDFIAFYQPYDLNWTIDILPIHNRIKDKSKSISWVYDIHDVLSETENSYIDAIHIKEHAREVIAEAISMLIINSYSEIR